MKFLHYLKKTKQVANKEKEILDNLKIFDDFEIRVAKNSLQVLIENLIGKSKRILKYYDCSIIPKRSSDAVFILYEVGYFEERSMQLLLK